MKLLFFGERGGVSPPVISVGNCALSFEDSRQDVDSLQARGYTQPTTTTIPAATATVKDVL
jgi:hypothetical protein